MTIASFAFTISRQQCPSSTMASGRVIIRLITIQTTVPDRALHSLELVSLYTLLTREIKLLKAAQEILETSRLTKTFPIDDVYLSGILRVKRGLPLYHEKAVYVADLPGDFTFV